MLGIYVVIIHILYEIFYFCDMKRVSKIDFLKNIHSGKFSNAFEAFLFSAGSTRQLWANMHMLEEGGKRDSYNADRDELHMLRRRYEVMASRLRKDGLLSLDMFVTKRGSAYLRSFFAKRKGALPLCSYAVHRTNIPIIIVFDIPESKKLYRVWLRCALRKMEFRLLQKSVWVGYVKIPPLFLRHLRDLKIVQCVEIIELSGRGTL